MQVSSCLLLLSLQKTMTRRHVVVPAGGIIELCKLSVNSVIKRIQGSLTTHIDIHTNISVFTLPLHVYDGKLQVISYFRLFYYVTVL